MASDDEGNTIIIKKIKKSAHGHHGGAWKVAYADFVTAMMAFFLLLWLIASMDETQKKGLADYFTPTIGLVDGMGIGFQGGERPTEFGNSKNDLTPMGVVIGSPPSGPLAEDERKDAMKEALKDAKLFEKAEESIKKAFEADPNLRELRDNIIVEQTPEGLKIEIMDTDKRAMYEPGSPILTEFGKTLIKEMSKIIITLPNHISITGHTDGAIYNAAANYTNWELSADRANSARRFMTVSKMEVERVLKIIGRADQELLNPDEPRDPKNRRITIILLRDSHMATAARNRTQPRSLLTLPKKKD